MLLLGDSHVHHALPLLNELAARANLTLTWRWRPGNPFVLQNWAAAGLGGSSAEGPADSAPATDEEGAVDDAAGRVKERPAPADSAPATAEEDTGEEAPFSPTRPSSGMEDGRVKESSPNPRRDRRQAFVGPGGDLRSTTSSEPDGGPLPGFAFSELRHGERYRTGLQKMFLRLKLLRLQFRAVVLSGFWTGYTVRGGRAYRGDAEKFVQGLENAVRFLLDVCGVSRVVLVRAVPLDLGRVKSWCGFTR